MNILIITEKPAIRHYIAAAARAHWPEDSITILPLLPHANVRFQYPSEQAFADTPSISEPQYSITEWEEWRYLPAAMARDGTFVEIPMSRGLVTGADLIVFACDPDPTGAHGFATFMRAMFANDRFERCPALILASLDAESVRDRLKKMKPFSEACSQFLSYGEVKRRFDWNWNVNARGVLKPLFSDLGVPDSAPMLSKYSLQLLYGLRQMEPAREGPIVHFMDDWKGTGTYQVMNDCFTPRLGSPVSMALIIENLLGAGFLEKGADGKVGISTTGMALLDNLHHDCEDADLPMRLHDWCAQGSDSNPAINDYIRAFFGKQKRFYESKR